MKQLFLCLLLGISPCLYAVNNLRLPGVRCMGMGECGVVQSALFNPAVVALDSYKSFDINYFNYYGLKELGTVGLSFSYPNNLLSELVEEKPQYLSADVGILFIPVEKLLIGMLIQDFPSVSIQKKEIDIESFISYSLQIGFQWEVINNLLIAGNAETNKQTVLTGCIGIEYQLLTHFYVRTGIKTTPLLPTLGIGYRLSGFIVDVAALYHPVLGISTGIGLKYCF